MKDGTRLINNRSFKLLSGHYFIFLRKTNKNDRLLIIDLVNEKGSINFVITDKVSSEVTRLDNPASGHYEFNIEKDRSYKIEIISKSACGKYSIRIKE